MEAQLEFVIFAWLERLITFWPTVLVFVASGVYALKYGADWLVDGSANLGFRFGISATMIGLTIVAFGTSAPELVVSVMTAIQGRPEICLGNVVGSNIANTSLILGATALVFPLAIQRDSIKFDGPLSFLAIFTVLLLAVLGNGLSRFDGILMLTIFAVWMIWLVQKSLREARARRKEQSDEEEIVFNARPLPMDTLLIAIGLIALVIGAKLLVGGAVKTSEALGVSDIVVGLTVVAVGTSLPELAVCLAAALKRHADITVGNVMGSNIFNAWLILGTAVTITPINFKLVPFSWTGDPGTVYVDIPFCVFLCAVVIPMMAHKKTLSRGKGVFLVVAYLVYIATLVIRNI